MVSIGKLANGQASYYLDQAQVRVDRATSVGSGVEDYYVGGTEAPGYWIGSGSGRVGARGAVAGDELRHVLDGHGPDGIQLVPQHSRRIPGFDITFSAPKSVSVLFGIGDERLQRAIRTAHDEAVADALGYLERVAARGRRKHGGFEMVEGHGFIAAGFRHRTSRAGDPQLHTHVLVANLVEGVDGKFSALDGRGIYQHGKTAGYLYEAALRERLTRRLGVQWGPVRNGIADIDGVPSEVLRAFSRRRAEVKAELERRGESTAAAARIATLATRRRKDYGVVPEQLVTEWRERAERLGFDRDALRALLSRRSERRPVEWARVYRGLVSASGLTLRRATFARRDLLQAMCDAVPPASVTVAQLEDAADHFLVAGPAVPMLPGEERDELPSIRRGDGQLVYSRHEERRYSTIEHLQIEQAIVDTAVAGAGCGVAVADKRALHEAMAHPLATEQETMLRRLVLRGDRVSVVLGQAGAGKTYALRAAREAWSASGVAVVGAAVSRRAARGLEDGAGVPSTSVAALLYRLRVGGEPLAPGSVVVVDEAGMLPTRELHELLERVLEVDGKLVLTGDHRQLPELEAGGSFRGLVYRLPAIILEENRRQSARWERAALRELRHGSVEAALAAYREHGRVTLANGAAEVRGQMVDDWLKAGGAPEAIMIALRRADVRDLNTRAREALVDAGVVEGRELVVNAQRFSAGDVVLVRMNDQRLDIANGDRGTVERIDGEAMVVNISGRLVTLDRSYLSQTTAHGDPVVAHGYAFTGHVAQGLTVRESLVLATDELYREWAYTALSRGTHANRLYVVGAEPRIRDEIAPSARETLDAGLLSALRRSRRQSMALDAGEPVPDEIRARLQAINEEREAIAKRLEAPLARRGRWWRRSPDTQPTHDLELRQRRLQQEEAEIWRALERPFGAEAREPTRARSYDRSLSR